MKQTAEFYRAATHAFASNTQLGQCRDLARFYYLQARNAYSRGHFRYWGDLLARSR